MKDEALIKDMEKILSDSQELVRSNYETAHLLNNYYKLMVRPYKDRDAKHTRG